jgi:hypothetical protein
MGKQSDVSIGTGRSRVGRMQAHRLCRPVASFGARRGDGRHDSRQFSSTDRASVVRVEPRQYAVGVKAVLAVQLRHFFASVEAAVADTTGLSRLTASIL